MELKKAFFERKNPNEVYSKIIINSLKTNSVNQKIVLLYEHRYKM